MGGHVMPSCILRADSMSMKSRSGVDGFGHTVVRPGHNLDK